MAPGSNEVGQMFNEIAPRYDFLNHFLSLGIDRCWRRRLVRELSVHTPRLILDVATGTGDLAIQLHRLHPSHITGIDIAEKMLEIGTSKIREKGLSGTITLTYGAAEKIPFADSTFDAVTVAFGVRNFKHLELGLSEMFRVLRPGGVMMILEFSHPEQPLLKYLYAIYSSVLIQFAGKMISGHNTAYQYLPDSVAAFPSGMDFMTLLHRCGLLQTRRIPMTMGIASIYSGMKNSAKPIQ